MGRAKRASARTGDRAYRVLTGRWRALPHFLIIGAQRAGTSSLYAYLAAHPQIKPAQRKEVHFFDLNHHLGISWYRSHFPTYRTLHQAAALTGEATPNYLFYPPAAERVRRLLPECRLVVLLRDPVERAFSAWNLMVASGYENLGFEAAIGAEPERIKAALRRQSKDGPPDIDIFRYSYLSRGHYAEQLERWFALFDRSQILVLNSEEFFAQPNVLYGSALTFLGLPKFEDVSFDTKNSIATSAMDPRLRQELARYFTSENLRLFRLLGHGFDWCSAPSAARTPEN